ncbi:hypothetical protein JRQ81_006692, partial [Phrynocephalus forsythii]
CNVMPGALLQGSFNEILYLEQCCPHEQGALEPFAHMLFQGSLHLDFTTKYIVSILLKLDGTCDLDKVHFILSVEV